MKRQNLFRIIQDRCDPDEIVDVLGIGTGELCLALRRQILEHRERFEEYLDLYEGAEYDEEEEDDNHGF